LNWKKLKERGFSKRKKKKSKEYGCNNIKIELSFNKKRK